MKSQVHLLLKIVDIPAVSRESCAKKQDLARTNNSKQISSATQTYALSSSLDATTDHQSFWLQTSSRALPRHYKRSFEQLVLLQVFKMLKGNTAWYVKSAPRKACLMFLAGSVGLWEFLNV